MTDKSLPELDWRVVLNRAAPPESRGWGRVRAAQLQEMSKALVVGGWGQCFNAVLIVYMLFGQVPLPEIGLWVGSLALLMCYIVGHRRKLGHRQLHSLPRRTLNRAAYHSIFFGLVWCVPARYFFEHANHGQQLALGVMTATMMAGAAFIFSPVPAAAFAYVAIMGVAVTHMLATTDSLVIAMIGPIYTTTMLIIVLLNGRAFMQRTFLDLRLEEREETVSLLLREYENSDADWLWQTNSSLALKNVSARFARALGRSAEEVEGMSLLDLLRTVPRLDQTARRALAQAEASVARREAIAELVIPVPVGDGIKCVELSGRPSIGKGGRFIGYHGVGSDVTVARQAADRIAHMARHDALTGLPNRLLLVENLASAIAGTKQDGSDCALLLVDLDRFKTINDSLGHIAGDHVLQQVAHCFETVISDDMTAGRLGGDEFAVVVPRVESRGELEQLCLALVGALQGPFLYRDQRLFVGASIGVAIGPRDGETVEELIRSADLALYRAKDGNGNDIRFFEPALQARAEERRRIEIALRGAVDAGELSLQYQPVVDAGMLRIGSFEALLRWHNPELGQVSPAKFIPIAEETGMLGRIGEWVLRMACREATQWPDDVAVAVNVSPRQLHDPGFIVTLISALTQAGLEPRRLELEVTETVFLELTAATQKILQQIQSLGVRLAMDDFGTGYSSLGYLRKADFDTLKIDRSFVQSISAEDPESSAIVRAVVALAGSLGMKTVAEGVANEEQLALVRALGCDRVQGYIFSRPVSAAAARALLAEQGAAAAA
ncbi:EAL domain-containing protein [Sphingosinicella sp. LHD-64]|uniref:putative bifunctional diguanylate cyclase/phosphodiesterase n=1 Tax=Sphingosinicella sp. LHD-64 TaxID=3072139 RepID=UPI00280EBDF6|nr:EAL domain-containing protein [Sphingosinicella sp. LHD-64]MDQ8755308.1 EAL domain-containing protein [Sphingosinicella sp. LHD-64]